MHFESKWGPRVLTIKVYNRDTERVDIHKNISYEEADWIALSPNLEVDVIDNGRKPRRREGDE